MEDFVVDSKTHDGIAVIFPQGYLNNIVGEKLEKVCHAYLIKGVKDIVVDFGKTEFINSIGISILLSILDKLKESNGTLCFTNMSSLHEEVFEVLGLTKYVLVFESPDEALKHLKDKKAA